MADGEHVDPERQRRIDELLESTRQLSQEARAPFLRQACADDVDLEHHIWSVLRAKPDVAGFLDCEATGVVRTQELRETTGATDHILTGQTISLRDGDRPSSVRREEYRAYYGCSPQ
jgi:hypothetical protein